MGEHDGADAYVQALRSVLSDSLEARRRAAALRKRLLAERTEDDFRDHAARLLLAPAGDAEDPKR